MGGLGSGLLVKGEVGSLLGRGESGVWVCDDAESSMEEAISIGLAI